MHSWVATSSLWRSNRPCGGEQERGSSERRQGQAGCGQVPTTGVHRHQAPVRFPAPSGALGIPHRRPSLRTCAT